MNNKNRKYKKPKHKTLSTTNSEPTSKQSNKETTTRKPPEPLCPLAAKDSEWVDILQTSSEPSKSTDHNTDEEEVLQLVECEDGPELKPLAIMFPGLLEQDPNTLQGMLTKAMSTTEVTKHLVDLGQKANFTFMKKADRLIPKDKQWLESVTENTNSFTSAMSMFYGSSISSDYDADNESTTTCPEDSANKNKSLNAKLIQKNKLATENIPQAHQSSTDSKVLPQSRDMNKRNKD